MRLMFSICFLFLVSTVPHLVMAAECVAPPPHVQNEWPQTDFGKCLVPYSEVMSGGPPKDGIPPIDHPVFKPTAEIDLEDKSPVIALTIGNQSKAYPLEVLMWHEIVNDTLSNIPISVTYCPLCNAAIVFDRRLDGQVLNFGTTGKLRNSDLIMYDRQTESWWQQYTGESLFGERVGQKLTVLPSTLIPWAEYRKTNPGGQVLIPNDEKLRDYGANPYVGYDLARVPFLYSGPFPDKINPMERVVIAGDKAWTYRYLRKHTPVQEQDLVITWTAGQSSALSAGRIDQGQDVGTVKVTQNGRSVLHKSTFAFVVHAFEPERRIIDKE